MFLDRIPQDENVINNKTRKLSTNRKLASQRFSVTKAKLLVIVFGSKTG